MEELKTIAKFAEGFRLQDLLREMYGDAAKPGAKQVGKALETVFGFVNTLLLPFALANERTTVLRNNMEKFRTKMQNTPEEAVCEVTPELGVPITEKLTYVTNEELSSLYVELLAKASTVKQANLAHPSFINVINNLAPDEAILIRAVKDARDIPFVEVRFANKTGREYIVWDPVVVASANVRDLTYPANVSAYFSNFEGLGLVQILADRTLAGENIYEPIESDARGRYSEAIGEFEDREMEFGRGAIRLTQFGELFVGACFSLEPLKKEK